MVVVVVAVVVAVAIAIAVLKEVKVNNEFLTQHFGDVGNENDRVYSLDEARSKYEVIELIPEKGWLVFFKKDEYRIKFAVLEFYSQVLGPGPEGPIMTKMIIQGEGTATLREMRHTYWGENGYLFYANGTLIIKALEKLRDYFDIK